MKIKEYKLKEGITINNLLDDKFLYSVDNKYLSKFITLKGSIILIVKVYLKDFKLTIDVLDDDFCQPYTPFYEFKENGKSFRYLDEVVRRYNEEMDNINSLENK